MNIFHRFGYSGQTYLCPIKPRPGEIPRFWDTLPNASRSPAHTGSYRNALDIICPDPRILVLPVFAPASGTVVELVQHHTAWGPTQAFLHKLNYITVVTDIPGEFYQLCHIGADSCDLSLWDRVETGDEIAETGLNGWTVEPRHFHIMVAMRTNDGFQSLKIRWKDW